MITFGDANAAAEARNWKLASHRAALLECAYGHCRHYANRHPFGTAAMHAKLMFAVVATFFILPAAHGAVMVTPRSGDGWLHVTLSPTNGWRVGQPQPKSFLSPWPSNPPSFWVPKAEPTVGGFVVGSNPGKYSFHDLSPEVVLGLDSVHLARGAYADGMRTFTYTAPGYSRTVSLPAGGVPEPPGWVLAAVGFAALRAAGAGRTAGDWEGALPLVG